jgi:hypothetical protein
MAYESALNAVSPLLTVNTYSYSAATSGLSATFFLNISGTTLGNNLTDDDCKLFIYASRATPSLSAINPLSSTSVGSIYISLSSPTVITSPVLYLGNIFTSTFNTINSNVTLGINFPVSLDPDNINLQTTVLYLSGNATTINFDPTNGSALDNFFFVSTNPSENSGNSTNTVRTTFGHSRLVASRG